MEKELEARQVEFVPSQANFVYLRPAGVEDGALRRLSPRGVIVRAIRGRLDPGHDRLRRRRTTGSCEALDSLL